MPPKNKTSVKTIERILFATDFSAASENAAAWALLLVNQNRAKLYVMHVVDASNNMAGFYVPHMSFERLEEEMQESAQAMIKRFCARHFPGCKAEPIVAVGAAHKEITDAVKAKGINMVVMAASGMGEVGRFLFGSTADRVLRHAACPVLIVPPSNR